MPLNLGILAHVDAGKTSLTERLLHASGATAVLGSVDQGTTRTDSLAIEQQRGITIRSAVTAITLAGECINIIDTPGHSDFIAEVERSLGVLDCAVLVLSAVEGVQPQTVILWRALRKIGVPTALFINKIDRQSASPDQVVDQIHDRLTTDTVLLSGYQDVGHQHAKTHLLPLTEPDVVEALAQQDAEVLTQWAASQPITPAALQLALKNAVMAGELFPILCGSAVTGAGLDGCMWLLTEVFRSTCAAEDSAEPSGVVFAIDHQKGPPKAWLRLWAGALRVRDQISVEGRTAQRVTHLHRPSPEGLLPCRVAGAGDIVAVQGVRAQVGDTLGSPPQRKVPQLLQPTLQATVTSPDPTCGGKLFAALTQLADEDPLIGLELDDISNNATVRLHGKVQQEVLEATLLERFGVSARFEDTSVACIERVVGSGTAVDRMYHLDNPYLATVGLELVATPETSAVEFSPGSSPGRLPASLIAACEAGIRSALSQGLSGWPVTGCRVTLTESGYAPRQSHSHQKFNKGMSSIGADFRLLAPVVVMACLASAGTRVCEPVEQFDLEVADWAVGPMASHLARAGATLTEVSQSNQRHRFYGHMTTVNLAVLRRHLPNMTRGDHVLTSQMSHYSPVTDRTPPTKNRPGPSPAARTAWFQTMRR